MTEKSEGKGEERRRETGERGRGGKMSLLLGTARKREEGEKYGKRWARQRRSRAQSASVTEEQRAGEKERERERERERETDRECERVIHR